MPELKIIFTVLAAAFIVIGGPAAGYFLALRRVRQRKAGLDRRERALRRRRIELEREQFQHSTARIHEKRDHDRQQEHFAAGLREELEQKHIELNILRQETEVEMQMLREENARLRKDLENARGSDAVFVDLHDTAPVDDPSPAHEVEAIDNSSPADEAKAIDNSTPVDVVEATDEAELPETPSDLKPDEPAAETAPEQSEPAAKSAPEGDEETNTDQTSEPLPESTPAPRKLESTLPVDAASDAASDVAFHWTPSTGKAKVPGTTRRKPSFRSVSDLLSSTAPQVVSEAGLRELLGLDRDEYELLRDLGYATYRRIAHLTSPEVHRLSDIFAVHPSHIYNAWIPGAQNRLHRDEPAPRQE